MQIRPANQGDFLRIAQFHVDIWAEVYPYIPASVHEARDLQVRSEQWEKSLLPQAQLRNPVSVVDQIYGIGGFSQLKENYDLDVPEPDFELHACYLSAELRGSLVGPALLAGMLDKIVALGGRTCLIWVWKSNPIKWTYFGMGFRVVCRRDRIIAGVPIPEIGLLYDDAFLLGTKVKKYIRRSEQSSLAGNRSPRPARRNPIDERIGKSQEPSQRLPQDSLL